jgi:hypothetical protein
MTTEVTIALPNDVYHRAEWLAKRTGKTVADVVAHVADLSLRPLGIPTEPDPPLSEWSDEAVLAAANTMMPEADDRRFSELLQQQQAGPLPATERTALQAFVEQYQIGMLRKAQALREAVRRGLLDPERL